MTSVSTLYRAAKLAAVLAAALALAACANNPATNPNANAGSTAPPLRAARRTSWSMSATACSSNPIRPELTSQSRGDARQAGAVAAALQPLHLHDRRPCRRARHARIQHRARRPPRPDGARLSGVARHRQLAHADDLLRQGAAGRGVQRHLLLVAEPPRRHGAQRELRERYRVRAQRHEPAPTGAGFALRTHFGPLGRLRFGPNVSQCGPPPDDHTCCDFCAPCLRSCCFSLCPVHAQSARRKRQAASAGRRRFARARHRQFLRRHLRPPTTASLTSAVARRSPPVTAQLSSSDLVVRLDRLENQIRQLTGPIEQLQYRNQQLEQQVRGCRRMSSTASRTAARARRRPPPATRPRRAPAIRRQPLQRRGPPPQQAPPAGAAGPRRAPRPRRSDAFDPNAESDRARRASRRSVRPRELRRRRRSSRLANDDGAGEEPVGAPGGRRAGAPLDLSTLSASAPTIRPWRRRGSSANARPLPPPPPRNPSGTGGQQQMVMAPPQSAPRTNTTSPTATCCARTTRVARRASAPS